MKNEIKKKTSERRNFLKKLAVGASAVALVPAVGLIGENSADAHVKKRLSMIIDLQKCTGCGSCTLVCKIENNVSDGMFWADKISKTTGVFPNVRYDYMPTLCNHCEDAPCVAGCPTQAMHKDENGITMHDAEKCVGCRYCMISCPYKVISFNDQKPHGRWQSNEKTLAGCASPAELSEKAKGNIIPYYNADREETYAGIRPKNVVEKCTFCDHRVAKGKQPMCVERCPSKARIFGDLNDPNSQVVKLLGKYSPIRLREELGTNPKVFYIKSYNPTSYHTNRGLET